LIIKNRLFGRAVAVARTRVAMFSALS